MVSKSSAARLIAGTYRSLWPSRKSTSVPAAKTPVMIHASGL
jgi:hypothetical protein